MKSLTLFGVVVALLFNCAVAQTANPFLGTWKVTWTGQPNNLGQTRQFEAELVVTDSGGSWKTYAADRGNPCVGRDVPIAIESSSAEEATIRLKFSEAVSGCPDSTVNLKRIDASTVTGTRTGARSTDQLALTKK